ncbi:type II and III secretion system protein family protein [Pseudomonas capsici]|uniref:type II and III secretion system protein family protein n=1 Tax=Pseudomonas capsici TaxID=2810614 RepID=UPI0021F201B9|nr:pilus assembly protein N-terminal domain-containing protein [Pseudomonas capsici]MCV4340818.1 pilus assembly protein N-terminal domain-containing protein [Pseudomonas capsici]
MKRTAQPLASGRNGLSLLLAGLGLSATLVGPSVVMAEQATADHYDMPAKTPVTPVITAQQRAQLQQISETQTVNLTVRQGRLLQLPRAAAKVLLADPEVASFQMPSPSSVFVFAQRSGATTLYALDANDNVIAAMRLVAGFDLEGLRQQIENEVVGSQVSFVPAAGDGLIVRGHVRTPLEARQVMASVKAAVGASDSAAGGPGGGGGAPAGTPGGGGPAAPRVINQLKVELSAQVNIRVRVVEVSRSLSHTLGLNWDSVMNSGKFRLATGSSTSLFNAANAASSAGTIAGATQAGQLIRTANTIGFTDGNLTGLINALSVEGMASVLAEPNLTAMSGETAGFAAGGEVPIVVITNNNVSITYKSYGVILRMTPTLLSPNRISLHIAPEVSDLSDDGAVTLPDGGSTIPAFKVRRADTTVELASGQSFALAGMLRSNVAQQVSGLPGLKGVPLLGRLFEGETSAQEDTELVILATAYVVDPVTEGELQTPGRGLPAMDAQMPRQASAGYLY